MIKIIFTQGKRKQVQTTKTKKARIKGIKKDFKGSVNFYQTRNYKFFLFTFFIWYNNFKNCSKKPFISNKYIFKINHCKFTFLNF